MRHVQSYCFAYLKPGFHMSGKSQTIRDFTFCRQSQILPIHRIIARSLFRFSRYWIWREMESAPKIEICTQMYDRETGAQQFRRLVLSEIHHRHPRRYKFEFSFVGNDRRPSQKSWTRRENKTLPIFQICSRPSQTIGDVYDFEFSLISKIWDSREAVKSPIVWDFPDIWKPGLKLPIVSDGNCKISFKTSKLNKGTEKT